MFAGSSTKFEKYAEDSYSGQRNCSRLSALAINTAATTIIQGVMDL
jgi:hypothetical protein